MATVRPLSLANGSTIFTVPGGDPELYLISLAADVLPSAGTITVEYQQPADMIWRPVPNAGARALSGLPLDFYVYGAVARVRVTLAGVVGGSNASVVLSRAEPLGLLPFLLTDPSTRNSRLRVDVGQTGFFAGREFRTFRELNVSQGAPLYLRANVPLNIILFGLELEIESGFARVETIVGGVEAGVWAETLPIFPRNTMSERPQPPYAAQVQLTAGGSVSGGMTIDVLRLKTNAITNQASTVGTDAGDERGVGAGLYYFRISAETNDPVTGVFRSRWEERPPAVIG